MAVLHVVLVLLSILLSGSATTVRYVRPTMLATCPTEPCLTLSDYVSNKTVYFSSNTNFILLEGEHYLNIPLVLNNVAYITMSGAVATGVTIIILSEASFSYTNSLAITLNSLEIVYHGKVESLPKSALMFDNSHSQIVNVRFTGLTTDVTQSRSLSFTQSTTNITNCSFSNGYSEYGGAIHLNSSNVTFFSVRFTNNIATVEGGAVFADNSRLTFSDMNMFLNNKISLAYSPTNHSGTTGGGAIFASQTILEFNGFNNFTENGPINANMETIFTRTLFGGAVLLQQNSTFTLQDRAIFSNNSGDSGGAVFSVNSIVSLSGSILFINNDAPHRSGGAIYAYGSNMHYQGEVVFVHNFAATGGAIFVERSHLNCQENVTFANNSVTYRGGGAYAVDSTVAVSGRISYLENRAKDGGGMGFEGTAQLVLQSPVTMKFNRNKAKFGGGLFFHDSNDMSIDQCQLTTVENEPCFFAVGATNVSSMDIHMIFTENIASAAGTVLYGGALQLCQVKLSEQINFNGLQFLESISTSDSEDRGNISSNPLKVCFCNHNGEANCSEISRTVNVRRGGLFNVFVITVGQFDRPVPSEVRALTFDVNATLDHPNHMNNGICSYIGFRLLTKDDHTQLKLLTDGPCSAVPSTYKFVEVILYPCPPGFDLVVNQCKCEKRLLELNMLNGCDVDTGLIERPGNSWIKPILDENQSYHGFILCHNCPFDYCKPPQETVLLNFSTDINDDQCTSNHTGTLCGACKDGYSLTLNHNQCEVCENKFISLLLFFSFAGIALIVILLALHMTVATGTINGLILYANIVNISRDIFFPTGKTNINPLSVFISWVNLDFGIPTCFYDGLDVYAYAWFQFAFSFYLWFLIGAIVLSNKVSAKVGKLFGSNPIAVLATVILMSFTKLLDTTIGVLSYRYLEYPDGSYDVVWTHNGGIAYFKGKHAILATFAICIILFLLLPYIFLLMFGYRLQAYSGKKGFFWFNKLKPILDAYYAPYNRNTRYWPGFMLLIRTCLFFSFLILNDVTFNYIAVEVSSLFMGVAIIAWLSNRLYEKLYVDILEASFILNICILTSASFHMQTVHDKQAVVTYLSVGVAFVEFVGIVIFHLYLRIKNRSIFKNWMCIEYMKGATMKLKTRKSNETETEVDIPLTTTSVVDIREPLLEDD